MQPRVVFRTHYQIDEPSFVGILVNECTSPTRGEYAERVAQRFASEVSRTAGRMNLAAAGYAVDLGRGLGVLNEQNVWTDLGMLVHLFSRDGHRSQGTGLRLDDVERLLYARVFLQGDGATLLFLARRSQERGALPEGDDDWNSVAKEMFVTIYAEYLKLSSTTVDRVTLRNELDRIRARGYQGKSGPHKCFLHLQVLTRVGLLARRDRGGGRRYECDPRSARFTSTIESVAQLEQVVRERRWADVVSTTLPDVIAGEPSDETVHALLAHYYERVTATGVPLCSLHVLSDAVQLHGMCGGELWPSDTVKSSVLLSQKAAPRDVRIHVDRSGAPAFVRFSDDLLGQWQQEATVSVV